MTAALSEFLQSLKMLHVWLYFGWSDTKLRYRRSVLGPFWLVLGTGVMVGGMGTLWSLLWKIPVREFFPYLAAGLITWTYLVSTISEGCLTFTNQATVIRNIPLPIWIHPLRQCARLMFIFLHNLVVYVVVALVFDVPVTRWTALIPVGLAVLFLNAIWLSAVLGMVSARLRDIPPIVEYVTPLFLFLTPILWKPEALGERAYLASFNPFTHYIEIVRAPLLGVPPKPESWWFVIAATLAGFLFALALMRARRARLAFWL